jgi:hypothetical protein
LVQTIWDNSSPTTDQPCRLITTLLLLVLHFYDYEQPNAPLPTIETRELKIKNIKNIKTIKNKKKH